MGTWAAGPFDNDSAADWAGDLDDARPEERVGMVRSALVVDEDYLDLYDGQLAVAAAAVVAAVREGAVPDSPYWPDLLLAGQSLDLPPELTDLALSAVDRVTGPQSELQEAWTESGPNDEWDAEITALRAALTRSAPR